MEVVFSKKGRCYIAKACFENLRCTNASFNLHVTIDWLVIVEHITEQCLYMHKLDMGSLLL